MSTAIVVVDAPSSDLAPAPTIWQSNERAHSAFHSLSQILTPPLSPLPSSSEDPAFDLLHDPRVASAVSRRLRMPGSGAGDDNLCRWLYDAFQSTDPSLQLPVLRFLPTLAGLYLSRCTGRRHYQPLAGFEAVLLALYAHETLARAAAPLTVDLPNLSAPNPYQDTTKTTSSAPAPAPAPKKNAEETPVAATAVLSHKLEPHGTMRSTRRARVVGVALELYYSKISSMPNQSKLEFCEFASAWAGRYVGSAKTNDEKIGEEANKEEGLPKSEVSKEEEAEEPKEEEEEEGLPKPEEPKKEEEEEGLPETEETNKEEEEEEEEKEEVLPKPEEPKEEEACSQESEKFVDCPEAEEPGERGERIPLPWELIQPTLRILGHCLLAPSADDGLKAAAAVAVDSLYRRAVHDMNTQAVLATRSLIRLEAMADAVYEPPPPASASEMSETAIVAV